MVQTRMSVICAHMLYFVAYPTPRGYYGSNSKMSLSNGLLIRCALKVPPYYDLGNAMV